MSVRRYQELVIWRVADELRREVYRLTDSGPSIRDLKFRDQLRASTASIASNIAEGFRRFGAADFAKFLQYAYASAGETRNWLGDGIARKHWTETDIEPARVLLRRLDPGLTGLMRYLRSPQGRKNSEHRTRTKPPAKKPEPKASVPEPSSKGS